MRVLLFVFAAALVTVGGADAQTAAQTLVERLVLDRAAVLASIGHQQDQAEAELLTQLTRRDRAIRAALANMTAAEADRARLLRDLSDITAERTQLAGTLAETDRAFTADLAAYRQQVTSIAGSTDPRRVTALQNYADGDRSAALTVLVQIQEAETRATAAGWREIGALVLDMADRGERTTGDAIAIFLTVTRLDPDQSRDWLHLVRLYSEAGRLDDAQTASNRSLALAHDDLERTDALVAFGDVLYEGGHYNEALAQYRASNVQRERAIGAASDPQAIRLEVFDTISRMIDVFWALGDADSAYRFIGGARRVSDYYAQHLPDDRRSLRMLEEVDHQIALGDRRLGRGSADTFRKEAAVSRELIAQNPNYLPDQARLAYALQWQAYFTRDDAAEAQRLFSEAQGLRQHLLAADPQSAYAQDGLAGLQEIMARRATSGHDLVRARPLLDASIATRRQLLTASPNSASARSSLIDSLDADADWRGASHDLDGQLADQREILALTRQDAAVEPASFDIDRRMIEALNHVSITLRSMRDRAGQVATLRETLPYAEHIARNANLTDRPWGEWIQQNDFLAEALQIMGDLTAAHAAFQASLDRELAQHGDARHLALAYDRLTNVNLAQHNPADALATATSAVAQWRAAWAQTPESWVQEALAHALNSQGATLLALQRPSEAVAPLTESLQILAPTQSNADDAYSLENMFLLYLRLNGATNDPRWAAEAIEIAHRLQRLGAFPQEWEAWLPDLERRARPPSPH